MKQVKAITWRTIIIMALCTGIVIFYGNIMGFANFFSTIMKTAHDLLLNTVFFIMAICVLAGALGGFMSEFGILALFNRVLAPVVRLLWGLPGAASIGAVSTFISDNPAIITLAKDDNFIRYFKNHQRPALTNFGTSFGMGLIVMAFMMSLGYFSEAAMGLAGAVFGSIISTRLMLLTGRRVLGDDPAPAQVQGESRDLMKYRAIRDDNRLNRLLESLLDGGKNGLDIGIQIIPGVLVICTIVLMMTFGSGVTGYNGSAYQGIPLLSGLGAILHAPLEFLFGFTAPDAISFPITALGAVGAALALVPKFLARGIIGGNEIAVFTAIGMTWSGFLSTHIAMMDVMGFRNLTSRAILFHTTGGISAGVFAHYLYVILA